MTQIRPLTQPRAAAVRASSACIRSTASISRCPTLEAARKFYSSFGLDLREEGGALNLHTHGHPHRWGSVVEGPTQEAAIHLVRRVRGRPAALPRAARRACASRASIRRPASQSNGLWFRDPDGTPIEIRVAEKSLAEREIVASRASRARPASPARRAAAPSRSCSRGGSRTSWCSRATSRKTIKFYSEVLGLRLSDRSGDMIAFMHAIHGSDHHVIAFVKSEGPGLHHLSWDVPSINDIGLGAMQMADKGFIAGWGLGRHVLGSNYFHYVRDPWGSYAEYSSDVDYIPVDHDWKSGDHPPEDSFYVWGPTPPADFAFNHEAVA